MRYKYIYKNKNKAKYKKGRYYILVKKNIISKWKTIPGCTGRALRFMEESDAVEFIQELKKEDKSKVFSFFIHNGSW